MILLWGIFPDRPFAAVHAALGRRGAPIFVLDQMNIAQTQIELQVGAAVTGSIRVGAAACDLAAISAVYVRCYDSRALHSAGSDVTPAQRRHAREVDDIVTSWLSVTPAFIVNPLSAMASNSSKPYQLSLIHTAGFATPDTLLTTDPSAVRAFWERHGQVIYKSISGVRSIVSRLKAEHGDRLDDIRWCPTQFQQHVPGRDYRVHIVGDELFACEIVSQADDYRYGARQDMDAELRACALPADCADRCHALAQSLALAVAGIDLRRTPDGEWFCFEVNPSPAFTYYATATGQPIAEAIAALLSPNSAPRQRADSVARSVAL
jgi:hypothetical protein